MLVRYPKSGPILLDIHTSGSVNTLYKMGIMQSGAEE